MSPISFPEINNLEQMEDFSVDEVKEALKKVKAKMSSGQDDIPLKLAKLFGMSSHPIPTYVFLTILSEMAFLNNGN